MQSNSDATTQTAIRRAILRWLARRDYALLEITQKLLLKNYTASDFQPILAEFVAAGFINEARFVENYIHFRRNKGFGPIHITHELKARGISTDLIAQHLQISDNVWLTVVQKSWQKQFKGRRPSNYQERAKQMRYLLGRGFTQEQIREVIEQDKNE